MLTGILGRFFDEMVSDAVGAKVLGKRSEGTLPTVSSIRYVKNKAKSRFTSRWIPMPPVWRTRNRSTSIQQGDKKMVLIDGRTLEQEFAYRGIEFLKTAVIAVLVEAKKSGECLLPKQISERLGIPPIKTKPAPSEYLIVNSILCALEKDDLVQRCSNNQRTWEISPIGAKT